MTASVYHTIVGLPSSGKTTFLAALWHLIEARDVTTRLILDYVDDDDLTYLNSITALWRKCEKVPRTKQRDDKEVAICVYEPDTNFRAKLRFPDLAGESFRRQIIDRKCEKSYVDGFDKNSAVMLFISTNNPSDGIAIHEMNQFVGAKNSPGEKQWDPEKSIPQQVMLVELLQFLLKLPFQKVKRKLAIMVSAWDLIENQEQSPERWLYKEFPLLHQFLICNGDMFEFRIYGISAQGGDLDQDRNNLLETEPSKRIKCYGYESEPHDITAPIHWLMRE